MIKHYYYIMRKSLHTSKFIFIRLSFVIIIYFLIIFNFIIGNSAFILNLRLFHYYLIHFIILFIDNPITNFIFNDKI